MTLKTINLSARPAKLALTVGVLLWLVFIWFFVRWDLAISIAGGGLDSTQPESRLLADWIRETAPDDPYSQIAAARFLEKTFEPGDLESALRSYEAAAGLSPNDFTAWMRLGASRDRNGDDGGAEIAYARALELAPNYAPVRWAYGNSLVRHGKTAEGMEFVAKAANSDMRYAVPAAVLALQVSDGNVDNVRQFLGNSSEINSAIADVLGAQGKLWEAYDAWSRVAPTDKWTKCKDIGYRLYLRALDAHETRIASLAFGDIAGPESPRSVIGQVYDGGFENGIKLRKPGPFEWQVTEGEQPQVGLSESTRRAGRYSLLLTFDSFEAANFRTISQRIAVMPGATYEMEGFYRADVKSKAAFSWEIVSAKTGDRLGNTQFLAINGDWARLHARFEVPKDTDGVILRFIRTGCGGGACPVAGRMWFDDLSFKQL